MKSAKHNYRGWFAGNFKFCTGFAKERNKLIIKYGEDIEGQTKVLPTSKRWPEFVGELNSLLEQEIDLGMEQVKLPDDIEITPAALIALEPFITIE